jgi:hypothetical protein
MGLGTRRATTSCFCSTGCNPGTYPFAQYWIDSFAPFNPFYAQFVLFRFKEVLEDDECVWESVENHFGPISIERLTKTVIADGQNNIVGFRWTLFIQDQTGNNAWSQDFFLSTQFGGIVVPEHPGSCSKMEYRLDNVFGGPSFEAVLRPAYPDACDDADRFSKIQRKPLAPF